ncbi:MAG: hypothetical protein AAF208_05160 [Cyanobacteria bacterium P01_A01_bin.45]
MKVNKINQLAASTMASMVFLGSVVLSAVNTQPAQALKARPATISKAELINVNFRHRGRRSFKRNSRRNSRRNFRRHGRSRFRYNFKGTFKGNFIHRGRRKSQQNLKFDKAFSTGNNFDERIIRVQLF